MKASDSSEPDPAEPSLHHTHHHHSHLLTHTTHSELHHTHACSGHWAAMTATGMNSRENTVQRFKIKVNNTNLRYVECFASAASVLLDLPTTIYNKGDLYDQ